MSGWKVSLLLLSFSLASVQIARCTPAIEPQSTDGNSNAMKSILGESEKEFSEKCRKNGGPTAFDDFNAAGKEYQTCFQNLVNFTALRNEVEKARPTGSFGPVVANLCKKEPAIKTCARIFTDAVERCLDKSEKVVIENLVNFQEAFVDFLCFQNGNNVILFFKDGGMDCLYSRTNPIMNCVNSTLGKYIKNFLVAEKSLFKFGEQECLDIYAAQECVVDEMYKCDKTTPGKYFEEMFNFMNRRISCSKVPKKMTEASLKRSTVGGVPPVGLVLSQSMTPMNATHMEMDLKLLMPRF